jgi:hypothetical protein
MTPPDRLPAERRTSSIARRVWRPYLAVGLVAAALYVLFPTPSDRWFFPIFGAYGVSGVFLGTWLHRPPNARSWIVAGTGVGLIAAGDLSYSILEATFGDSAPFPSVADAIYLVGYVVLALGLAGLVRARTGGRDRGTILDGLIVATAVGLAAWVLFLHTYLDASGLTPAAVVSLAYPFMDLVLLAMAVQLLIGGRRFGTSQAILVVGLGAFLTSDFVYAYQSVAGTYHVGSLVDLGWMLGHVGWGASALHPSMAVAPERRSDMLRHISPVRVLPLAAALVPPGLLWLPDVVINRSELTVLVLVRVADLFAELNTAVAQGQSLERQLRHTADHDPPGRPLEPTRLP